MQHSFTVSGYFYRLVPVELSDSENILRLRTDLDRAKYLNSTQNSTKVQRDWISGYFERENEYYFRITKNQDPESCEGFVSAYNFDEDLSSYEWGRWIVDPKSLSAVESAHLIYKFCFETLNARSVYCITVADNKKVVSFHDSCELDSKKILRDYYNISGEQHDGVRHEVRRDRFVERVNPRLEKISKLLAKKLASTSNGGAKC